MRKSKFVSLALVAVLGTVTLVALSGAATAETSNTATDVQVTDQGDSLEDCPPGVTDAVCEALKGNDDTSNGDKWDSDAESTCDLITPGDENVCDHWILPEFLEADNAAEAAEIGDAMTAYDIADLILSGGCGGPGCLDVPA